MKMYAMMLSTTDDMFAEELWTRLSEIVEVSDNRLFFFCGKPLDSPVGDERYSNVIFNLMKDFPMDGLIISSGALSMHVGQQYLENYIQNYSCHKIVSITLPLANHPYVVLGNKKGSYDLTKHLIQEHGYTNYGYLTGPEGSSEIQDRFDGFECAIKNYGTGKEQIHVAHGDFSQISGRIQGEYLIRKGVEIIVCDNDEMAHGVYEAAQALGIQIPNQVAVVGFDDVKQAALMEPPLSTVSQTFDKMAEKAYNILEKDDESQVLDPELIIRASCGCDEEESNQSWREMRSQYLHTVNSYKDMMTMATNFNHAKTFKDLTTALKAHFDRLIDSEFYLCVYEEEGRPIEDPATFTYPKEMILKFGYNRGILYQDISYLSGKGLPDEVYEKIQSKTFLVHPIGLNDVSYGYIIVNKHIAQEMSFITLKSIISNVLSRIYSYRKLNDYNNQLMDYAYKDSLTNLYNRRGLFNAVVKQYETLGASDARPIIFYCDVNGLKTINDTYGHATGDDLIIKAARVLEDHFTDGIISRVGGDEFVIYINDITLEEAEKRVEFLMQELDVNLDSHKQVKLSMSLGYCAYDDTCHHNISDLIDDADKNLYKVKNKLYKGSI